MSKVTNVTTTTAAGDPELITTAQSMLAEYHGADVKESVVNVPAEKEAGPGQLSVMMKCGADEGTPLVSAANSGDVIEETEEN